MGSCLIITNPTTSSMSNTHLTPDHLTSYQHACQSFDSTLQHRTTAAIAGSLLDMNQDIVKLILECKNDIWKNEDLFSLVQHFFNINMQTLDICMSLETCLKNARRSLSFLQTGINKYDLDGDNVKMLDRFKKFKEMKSLFSDEFFKLFRSVYEQQVTMLKKLQTERLKVNKRLKLTKTWRRLSKVIFLTTLSTVLICSVVAAAVSAPPLVTALAAAVAAPLGSMRKWVNSLWKKYEKKFKDEKEMMGAMHIGSYIVIKDLEDIKALMDKLWVDMEGVVQNGDFAVKEDDTGVVGMVVDEMKKTVSEFAKTIDDLNDHLEKCIRDTRRARTVILQRIIKHSSDSI